jgi:hypothetical protein
VARVQRQRRHGVPGADGARSRLRRQGSSLVSLRGFRRHVDLPTLPDRRCRHCTPPSAQDTDDDLNAQLPCPRRALNSRQRPQPLSMISAQGPLRVSAHRVGLVMRRSACHARATTGTHRRPSPVSGGHWSAEPALSASPLNQAQALRPPLQGTERLCSTVTTDRATVGSSRQQALRGARGASRTGACKGRQAGDPLASRAIGDPSSLHRTRAAS